LPDSEYFNYVAFDPTAFQISSGDGTSAASGQNTIVQLSNFGPSFALDGDGDGLTDDAEFAVGTLENDPDSD